MAKKTRKPIATVADEERRSRCIICDHAERPLIEEILQEWWAMPPAKRKAYGSPRLCEEYMPKYVTNPPSRQTVVRHMRRCLGADDFARGSR